MAHEPETRVLKDDGSDSGLTLPGVKLTVLEGSDRGLEVLAKRGIVRVGTAPDNDLVLADNAVSRRHLEVRVRADAVSVRDLGSTNGSTVDGVRIIEAILSSASLIQVGATVIRATPVEEPLVIPLSSRREFGRLLGQSVAMREAFAVLERAAPTDATVLVEGETGTGKELAAEAIHMHSPRAEGPFVAIDCGAIAPNLMESELFGHVRGAFTGAVGERLGVFEEANGGTIFLDEIGELPLDLQPKLLRVLEKREVRRVGAARSVPIDVRVVAATNRDLAVEVNRGGFREDLYFRLAVVQVKLPPLRARREDIPDLVGHFVECFTGERRDLAPELIQALAARPWPGNVRELRNAVERAVAMAVPSAQAAPDDQPGGGAYGHMQALFPLPVKEALERWNDAFERAYWESALRLSGGSVSGAARAAGVNRRYVQRVMKRHGLRSDGDG